MTAKNTRPCYIIVKYFHPEKLQSENNAHYAIRQQRQALLPAITKSQSQMFASRSVVLMMHINRRICGICACACLPGLNPTEQM